MCRAAQGGQLPLHCAAANGASLEAVTLLLKANPKAASSANQARCCAHAVVRASKLATRGRPCNPPCRHNLCYHSTQQQRA